MPRNQTKRGFSIRSLWLSEETSQHIKNCKDYQLTGEHPRMIVSQEDFIKTVIEHAIKTGLISLIE